MKRITLFLLTLSVLAAMLLAACGGAGAPSKVRVATDATFPPFETVDENTKAVTGFDVELMNAIAAKAGFEVEWVNINFDAVLSGIAQCQYDAAIAAITITPERQKTTLFSDPYINAGQIVTVRKDNTSINSKNDLSGKTAGAQIGTTGAIEIQNIQGATLKTYDTYDLAFLDLINGQIDAVVADYPTALGFVGKNADKLKTVGDVFTNESYGIAVCKNKADLLKKINDALATLKSDGTVQNLEQKWLAGVSQ